VARFVLDENQRRTVFDVDKDAVVVGRATQSDIAVLDLRASRNHCRIERHGNQHVLVDLGSQNGTLLNGHLVDRAPLKPGDVIGVGSARLWFEKAPPPDVPVAPTTEGRDTMAGVQVPGVPTGESEDRLLRLQRIAKAMNSELHLDRLLAIIMDHFIELSGAERGFLVLAPPGEPYRVGVARNFEREEIQFPHEAFSRGIVEQVLRERKPVLAANAVEDERFQEFLSINAIRARSVLCIPLLLRGRALGAVYVDNRLQRGAFGAVEQQMLSSLADFAAIAVENARLYEENERRARELEGLNAQLASRVEVQAREIAETRDRLRKAGETTGAYPEIVGRSPVMRDLLRLLDKIVASEEPVLIEGESGVGKELIAKAIHQKGPRARQSFLSENCAALPDTLLESELFGHVRGAFTGAERDKKGLFELADKGTLFLDEIGDMSPDMQKKLLRALQEGEIRPVGGKAVLRVDVRIISASNKDLRRLVDAGEFREDLYYRLKVLTIRVPPLRKRKEDIPVLADHFLRLHTPPGRRPKTLGEGVMDRLLAHDWPGNIRELENEVKLMIALGEEVIDPSVLSESVRAGPGGALASPADGPVQDLNALVERVERAEIEKALRRAEGNKTHASDLLGISRFTLQRKLEKYGMEPHADAEA
jgi:transcriptional regulator with GAF, ATPase, and Fis domain